MGRQVGGEHATLLLDSSRVRELRVAMDLSQDLVAQGLRVSAQMVSLIERGLRPVTPSMAQRLAKVLRTEVETIVVAGVVARASQAPGDAATQLTVFVEDRVGVLLSLTTVIAAQGIGIRSLVTVADEASRTGSLTFVVDPLADSASRRLRVSLKDLPAVRDVFALPVRWPSNTPTGDLVAVCLPRSPALLTIVISGEDKVGFVRDIVEKVCQADHLPDEDRDIRALGVSTDGGEASVWFVLRRPTPDSLARLLESLAQVDKVKEVFAPSRH